VKIAAFAGLTIPAAGDFQALIQPRGLIYLFTEQFVPGRVGLGAGKCPIATRMHESRVAARTVMSETGEAGEPRRATPTAIVDECEM
jgi:hypothetical protein